MSTSTNPSPAEIVAAMQRGGIVEALKVVLAKRTGSRADKNPAGPIGGPSKPFGPSPLSGKVTDLSPGEVPRSNNDIWFLLLLMAALCIAYFFWDR